MRIRLAHFGGAGLLLCIGLGLACASSSPSSSSEPPATLSTTGSNFSEEAVGRQFGTVALGKEASDPSFGYSEKSPVQVGGGFGDGAHNAYRYLNSLSGPGSQQVHYDRVGTCCPFKTPKSPFDGEGVLEVYEILYEGGKPVRLYFNWYDSGELLVPVGLKAQK